MQRLEESKRDLDEAMARLDESMRALEAGIPDHWPATTPAQDQQDQKEALKRAEILLSRSLLSSAEGINRRPAIGSENDHPGD